MNGNRFFHAFSRESIPNSFPISCFFSAGVLSTSSAISPCLMYIAFKNRSESMSKIWRIASLTSLSPVHTCTKPLSLEVFVYNEDFRLDFFSRTILYSLPLEMKSNSTDIEFALFLTRSSIFLAVCCLNKAKLIASKIVDFPAPFSPTITLIPFLSSIIVFL